MYRAGKDERNHPAFKYGTDKQFLEWVSKQPSVIDGLFNQYDPDRNIPCHVRRHKDGAGAGHKPPYSAVAMTDAQHRVQSLVGEAAVLNEWNVGGVIWTAETAAAWFELQRDISLAKWIESKTEYYGEHYDLLD